MDPNEVRPLSCRERGCQMVRWQDYRGGPVRYQHGENPEAVLEIPWWRRLYVRTSTVRRSLAHDTGGEMAPSDVEDWADRVHAYEDGA